MTTDMNPHNTSAGSAVVLAAICAAALVLPLDFSGAAAATSAIGRDLGGSPAMLAWIVNAFMLTFGSTLLTVGVLADEFGRRRVFVCGLASFVVVSVAMCFSTNLIQLNVMRALQGVAAAGTLAGGSAALAQEFHGARRTWAFSLLGTTFGTGLAFGPTIAGFLISAFGWRSIFLSAAIVGSISLLFGIPRMRETRNQHASGPDWLGAIFFMLAIAAFTAAMLEAPEYGWATPQIIGLLTLSALALASFVAIELRTARPMLDLSLFRYPRFIGIQALPIATTFSYVVLVVLLPSRLIGVEGYDEATAGICMLALSGPMLVIPLATANCTKWLSPAILSTCGLALAIVGLFWLAEIPPGTPLAALAWPMILIGCGSAMPWGLMDGLSVSVVPPDRAGMATGIFSTVRVAGEGLAIAIVHAVLAVFTHARLARSSVNASHDQLSSLAYKLSTGDLPVSTSLPQIDSDVLLAAYGSAFRDLMHLLALVVACCATIVFFCLRYSVVSETRVGTGRKPTGDN
ncbi:MFS transporter [Bradyrhizobium japonicum]|uniref:MFS transporter n=1 Tax=Bradyrhizobium japonicum TaxID=375 RepID=A0A1L3F9Q7_BRAJP|nr:MFS transporter [Bradyrhizobium japonicum]APG09982.1 MFS transporter [Bradyrhizobium japonicum]